MDTTFKPRLLNIGSVLLNIDAEDTDSVVMPQTPCSYTPETPQPSPLKHQTNTIYIVLQHSKAAGNSALLPFSNVVGVFPTRVSAQEFLQILKEARRPVVREGSWESDHGKGDLREFWCMGSGEDGGWYVGDGGEEFVIWIEEHVVRGAGMFDGR